MIKKAVLYFHTLRYLKPVQIYGRLWKILYRPKADLSLPPAIRPQTEPWTAPILKEQSLLSPVRFQLLNEIHDILSAKDWNNSNWSKLWLYNLHYFDDLNAQGASERKQWHNDLMSRWILENPPAVGNGWEPYPLSLRIVNWLKWALAGNILLSAILHSLAVQVRFLSKQIEYHILGNHILANAKALIFAGCFFKGQEAENWLNKGLRILSNEIPEQILDDGGHFELSPMYHCIVLEDVLDLINLFRCYAVLSLNSLLLDKVKQMMNWLAVMCHQDKMIAFFNDTALGIAADPEILHLYGDRLGINKLSSPAIKQDRQEVPVVEKLTFDDIRLTHLKTSGYIRVDNGPMTAFLDVAEIGPDYLPGHAHADTLSFEVSFNGQRVVVNSGTSLYGEGAVRLEQRSTSSHNTVMIGRKDSSEVWGGFRVGRRAKPFGLEIKETVPKGVLVRCAHDGYQRLAGKPIHWREWYFEEQSLMVKDVITGKSADAIGRVHFHPSVKIDGENNLYVFHLSYGKDISCQVRKGCSRLVDSTYNPKFGVSYANQCMEVELDNNESQIVFNW
ncbi:MAG TPA: alginate lyase family protein [Smithellaceae bacterium]|nr:alginate lyase family protein [Smithellaceae bacterium]